MSCTAPGVHVFTVYRSATATATAMMDSSQAGEDLGFGRREVGDVVADLTSTTLIS